MKNQIEKLRIKAFRGATGVTELEFDSSLRVCLIFGENGAGKSSIVDAIDFVCNGTLGSLDYRKLSKGKRKEQFIPSVGKTAGEVNVELTSNGTTWTAKHSKSGVNRCNTPNRPIALVLRRSTLLEFVENDPAKRYEALTSYIAVSEVEKGEGTLREAIIAIERDTDQAARSLVQAETALEALWQSEGLPGASYLDWAKAESAKEVDTLSNAISNLGSTIESYKLATSRLNELKNAIDKEKVASDFVASLKKKLESTTIGYAVGASQLLSTLERAKEFLQTAQDSNKCPVCLKPADRIILGNQIQERIDDMNELKNINNFHQKATQEYNIAKVSLTTSQQQFIAATRIVLSKLYSDEFQAILPWAIDWNPFSLLLPETPQIIDHTAIQQAMAFTTKCDEILPKAIERHEAAHKSLYQRKNIRLHLETINNKSSEATQLATLRDRAKEALRTLEDERKRFVESILNSVTEDVSRLYSLIHPGEAIGGLKLVLDPKQRASLNFEGKFESETSAPPQAYYSESHLDTLGICIFLSLAKKFGLGNVFVVLDDVLTSVDQPHLSRFIDALHHEAEHYRHLLLTTHYRPWRDTYIYGRGSKIQILDLLPWSLSRGIRHTKTKIIVVELADQIQREVFDRQVVASKAGILLEQLLDHITLLYRCSLPRKSDQRYTLGDFSSGIDRKLMKALKVVRKPPGDDLPVEEIVLAPQLTELLSKTWIRNLTGCHFNLEDTISSHDITDFAKRVVEFAMLLVCPSCGELPRNPKSGVDYKCRCGSVRMSPFAQPG
jgi:recombinational DNA repair ATPase RecF